MGASVQLYPSPVRSTQTLLIHDPLPGHRRCEGPQAVLDADRLGVLGEDVRQASMGLRRLVDLAA